MNTGVGSIIQPHTQSSKRKCGLIALTTNVSIFDSECSLPLTIRKHKEWFFRPVQGRHYVLATLRNRKRQTQDSNPRFTAPTEIRRKHRPQMDGSDDFVTLSQARIPRETQDFHKRRYTTIHFPTSTRARGGHPR